LLNTITHLPAGRSLNVLVDLLTELARAEGLVLADPWKFIAESAARADRGRAGRRLGVFSPVRWNLRPLGRDYDREPDGG